VAGFESRFYQGLVADQIHSGLAIQDYNLLEVKFDLGAMSLFEELGNSWFIFDCHLFHLGIHCQTESVNPHLLIWSLTSPSLVWLSSEVG
jgi:hypothetical protein